MSQATITQSTPTFTLKPLSKAGLDGALSKAEHYRLLNQPMLAESICRDILLVDPGNQKASIVLLLSLTDQFGQSSSLSGQAQSIANQLKDEYARTYYLGIVHERLGAVALNSGIPGAHYDAFEWYMDAMKFFEKADAIDDASNNDSALRWNTCARIIMHYNLKVRPVDDSPMLE